MKTVYVASIAYFVQGLIITVGITLTIPYFIYSEIANLIKPKK